MAKTEIKNIFLSASVPFLERNEKFVDTADIIAIRDAVISLASVVLPHHRIIWGGHPSITPLIYYVMEKLNIDIQQHVTLYQSKLFERYFPKDNNKFKNVILIDAIDEDREASLYAMRKAMLSNNDYVAAVFIGGMEGVIDEYHMFRNEHPEALLIPVASTGAAAKIIYDDLLDEQFKDEKLLKEYGYMSLFQRLLLDEI